MLTNEPSDTHEEGAKKKKGKRNDSNAHVGIFKKYEDGDEVEDRNEEVQYTPNNQTIANNFWVFFETPIFQENFGE